MKEFTYTIKEPVGIHARPAGMLAKEAKTCQSTVTIVDTPYIMDSAAPALRARYPLHTPRPEDVLRDFLAK